MKLNKLQSIREVIDIIDEIENKPYYASNVFSDPVDSFRYEKPISVENLPFLDDKNISIPNFGKMIKKSNNFREIGKFIAKINNLSPYTAEKLVHAVCSKIDASNSLREVLMCLHSVTGGNHLENTNNASHLNVRDYRTMRLLALIVQGLDAGKLENKFAQSNRLRDIWECLHLFKISDETVAWQMVNNLEIRTVADRVGKTSNPHNTGNLLKILQKTSPEKCNLLLQALIEQLRSTANLKYAGNCYAGIANFSTEAAFNLLHLIAEKMNHSNSQKELGECLIKISWSNKKIIPELFMALKPEKQDYLKKRYSRYLKTLNE
jgi:hypothetical protein